MRTIKKQESLKQQIYKIVKDDIMNQRYNDDDILNERTISEELQVSRTPVREALKALESEDWVEYVPYKGIIVKKMGEKELKNIFQIRTVLELLTIELVMQNLSEELVARLEECHQRQRDTLSQNSKPPKEHFIDLDIEFHGILLNTAGNDLLTSMIGDIRDKIRRFGLNAIFSGEYRYAETLEEHLGILQAVKAKNVTLAKEKMQYHMQKTYENAYNYVTSHQKV